jgi:NAD(P)-dependent dehydrogenase (short-subunit alcohol dehydrogenase family)
MAADDQRRPGLNAVSVKRTGAEGSARVLAKDVRPLGIYAAVIEPGGFRTDWAAIDSALFEGSPRPNPAIKIPLDPAS